MHLNNNTITIFRSAPVCQGVILSQSGSLFEIVKDQMMLSLYILGLFYIFFPIGAKKLLLRRNQGVQLGFETLLNEKMATLDFKPMLTFDPRTTHLVKPTPQAMIDKLNRIALSFMTEKNDVNRTRRVS
jgi:hypothetical protein